MGAWAEGEVTKEGYPCVTIQRPRVQSCLGITLPLVNPGHSLLQICLQNQKKYSDDLQSSSSITLLLFFLLKYKHRSSHISKGHSADYATVCLLILFATWYTVWVVALYLGNTENGRCCIFFFFSFFFDKVLLQRYLDQQIIFSRHKGTFNWKWKAKCTTQTESQYLPL